MGRETILTNVTWENGSWPVFHNPVQGDMRGWSLPGIILDLPGHGYVETRFMIKINANTLFSPFVDEGDNNLTFPPDSSIPPHFAYWRPPLTENYAISVPDHPNTLRLKPSKLNLTAIDGNSPGPGGQTFISRRQVDTLFDFSFDLDYQPKTLEEEAGISLFLTQNHHARFGIAMLPLANSTSLVPHFRFHAISYIRVPPDFTVPVDESWLNKPLTMILKTVNITHYAFGAGPADGSVPIRTLAHVPGDIISWGFTGALLGAYATTNGGNGSAEAYVTNWNYRGWGQVRDNWNGTMVP